MANTISVGHIIQALTRSFLFTECLQAVWLRPPSFPFKLMISAAGKHKSTSSTGGGIFGAICGRRPQPIHRNHVEPPAEVRREIQWFPSEKYASAS